MIHKASECPVVTTHQKNGDNKLYMKIRVIYIKTKNKQKINKQNQFCKTVMVMCATFSIISYGPLYAMTYK